MPTAFASFPFTSRPVRHRVPSRFNWTLLHNFTDTGERRLYRTCLVLIFLAGCTVFMWRTSICHCQCAQNLHLRSICLIRQIFVGWTGALDSTVSVYLLAILTCKWRCIFEGALVLDLFWYFRRHLSSYSRLILRRLK